jgi:hypothetical protein
MQQQPEADIWERATECSNMMSAGKRGRGRGRGRSTLQRQQGRQVHEAAGGVGMKEQSVGGSKHGRGARGVSRRAVGNC